MRRTSATLNCAPFCIVTWASVSVRLVVPGIQPEGTPVVNNPDGCIYVRSNVMLSSAARQEGLAVFGPVGQGEFLSRLGIGERAAALTRAAPARAAEIEAARNRLVAPDEMGRLFKVLGAAHPAWPAPEGFA